jgi:hypothetical protein
LLDDLDRLADDVLGLLSGGAVADAPALTFLLQRYRVTDRADLRVALEPALAGALDRQQDALTVVDRAAYLGLFLEAAAVADDERVGAAIEGLVVSLRADWAMTTRVAECACSLDACLAAAAVLDPRDIVPDAIDELERVIGGAYRPGEGLADDLIGGGARGGLDAHVRSSSALLTAFRATGRIPYAMLAEELMQFARRTLWDEAAGVFAADPGMPDRPFVLNCAAAGVYLRIAALHTEGNYRDAAVIATDADYRGDAARILSAQSARLGDLGVERAVYGLTLADWLDRS